MPTLNLTVNPCPSITLFDPIVMPLLATCPGLPHLIMFVPFRSVQTFGGPFDPNAVKILSSAVNPTEYSNLCSYVRLFTGGPLGVDLDCDLDPQTGYLTVRHVRCPSIGLPPSPPIDPTILPAIASSLESLKVSSHRIEGEITVNVQNELHAIKAQLAEVINRLPPHAGSNQHHVPGLPIEDGKN